MSQIYLMVIKKAEIGGRTLNKLFLLPNQPKIDDEDIDIVTPVQCPTNLQNIYDIGTIVATTNIKKTSASAYSITNCDSTGHPTKLGVMNRKVKASDEEPTPEMVKVYQDYCINYPKVIEDIAIITSTKSESEKEGSRIGMLMKKYPAPTIKENNFFVDNIVWRRMLLNIIKRDNTLLMGTTGTGKTQLVFHLAKSLGLPLHVIDMGACQDAAATLLGVHRLVSTENGPVSKFDYSPFVEYIQKPGIILLDEVSRASVEACNILFPAIDKEQRVLRVDAAGTIAGTREFLVNSECIFFATMNEGADYTGTQQLDEAFKDRFKPNQLDYMPKETECELLQKKTGISKEDANSVATIAETIRNKWKQEELSRPISIRETLSAAFDISYGLPLKDALMENILYFFNGEGGESSERAVVKNIIMSGRA